MKSTTLARLALRIGWIGIGFAHGLSHVGAQDLPVPKEPFSSHSPLLKEAADQVSFSGFYRFLGYVRHQKKTFPNNSGKTTAIVVGDFYREPMLLLRMKGRTKDNISFGADFMINSVYKGPSEQFIQPLTLDLGLNLRTRISTKLGQFSLRSGGISWYRQSRLTVWGNQAFNRNSIFHRRPQTPLNNMPWDRYNSYYNAGLIDQGVRYGARAFQGLFLEGNKLPFNLAVKGVLGKSNFNRSFLETNDNFTSCFQIKYRPNADTHLSYNVMASRADVDSLSSAQRRYAIHTMGLSKAWSRLSLKAECGVGSFSSPTYNLGHGEALVVELRSTHWSKLPVTVQGYRISPQFVNVTGNFFNTTVLEVFPNVSGIGSTIRTPYKSPMVGLGIPANNRQGASINVDFSEGRLKVNGGVGVFAEIDTSSSGISYIHNVNSQTLSRLFLFGQDWGPYNQLNSTYRGVFEEVNLTDSEGAGRVDQRKHFSTLELQVKYNMTVFKRSCNLFSLTRLNSVQHSTAFAPKFDTTALVSQACQEFDVSISCTERAVFVGHFGIERVIGNQLTDLGDANIATPRNLFFEWSGWSSVVNYTSARNQRNRSIGLGIDYKVGPNVMFFIRHQWYRFVDPNFLENHISGTETMLELKLTF